MKKILLILVTFCVTHFVYSQDKKDSVVQKQDTVFALYGTAVDFNFLAFAINNPQDVTPRQIAVILDWIKTIRQVIPAVATKPKEVKPPVKQ